jgi:hypothetical protein
MNLVLTQLSFSLAADAQLARPAALEDISVASVGGDIIIHGSIQNDIRYPSPRFRTHPCECTRQCTHVCFS